MKKLLVRGGKVCAESAILEGGYVLVEDGRIVSIGAESELDPAGITPLMAARIADCETVDATGLFVVPGFIDMHTHGMLEVDFMESSVEATVGVLREYAKFGVTRVVASTLANPMDTIIAQVRRLGRAMEDRDYGFLLHGVHVEGPWLAPRCRGGHALGYLKAPNPEDVNRLLGETGTAVKTVTFAPELPGSVDLVERLVLHGIVASIGHTEASYEEGERAILAGARHATHLYDTNLGYREDPDEALVMLPGHETALLMHDEVSIELIGCPVHVRKPFFRFIDKVKPPLKKIIVTDSLIGTGCPDGKIITYADGRKVYPEDGVLRMIDADPKVNGNLTGSAATMNLALKRLAQFAGLPVEEAVRWGSINPATTLGIAGETGSLAVGKWADIVVMDGDFQVKVTIGRGRIVHGSVTKFRGN
jgi:N-acetylglucosamine-6-phosphate deacetylase